MDEKFAPLAHFHAQLVTRTRALLNAPPETPEWEAAKRRLELTLRAIERHPEQPQNSTFLAESTRA